MTFVEFGEMYPNQEYRRCRCNYCGHLFGEEEILIDEDTEKEYCPVCVTAGYIQDQEGSD